jgi:hypothetical protein
MLRIDVTDGLFRDAYLTRRFLTDPSQAEFCRYVLEHGGEPFNPKRQHRFKQTATVILCNGMMHVVPLLLKHTRERERTLYLQVFLDRASVVLDAQQLNQLVTVLKEHKLMDATSGANALHVAVKSQNWHNVNMWITLGFVPHAATVELIQ